MKKIIVTGGAGFIGSHIVDTLVAEGYEVHVVDNLSSGKKENVNEGAILHEVDIRDRESLSEIFKNAECVFHEAALPQVQFSIENPIATNDVNVNGLLNVLEAARENNIKRFIFTSSCAVYGDQKELPIREESTTKPLSPYGAQKLIGEVYCKLYSQIYGLETVCLRCFNVCGPRQSSTGAYASVVPKFLEFYKKGEPMTITGNGEQTRDFVSVSDVVRANIFAMESKNIGKGEIINIGTGKQYSVNYIAEIIGGEKTYIPARVELGRIEANIEKAKNLLGWEPREKLEDVILKLKANNN